MPNNVFLGGPMPTPEETMPAEDTSHVKLDSTNGSRTKLPDMPIDLTTATPRTSQTEPDDHSLEEKIKQLSDKIKNSHTVKRKPPSIIDCNTDPTVRKRHRELHPMNRISTKSMKKSKIQQELPAPQVNNEEEEIITPPSDDPEIELLNDPKETDNFDTNIDNIIKCDLTVSDSESELEEGEMKPDKSVNNTLTTIESECPVNPTENKLTICPSNDLNSGSKKAKSVVINTDANTVLEYTPENLNRRERKYPEYNPTKKNEEYKVPSVPTHQVLYDLWKIVRNCDQFIGDSMERAMLQAGYLKPRH